MVLQDSEAFLLHCTQGMCCFSDMLHNVWHLGGGAWPPWPPNPPSSVDSGQVLRMRLPKPDEAVEEEQLVDGMTLGEGFVDVAVDVKDLTVSVVDDAEVGPSQIIVTSATELLQPSAAPSASSVSMNNNSTRDSRVRLSF